MAHADSAQQSFGKTSGEAEQVTEPRNATITLLVEPVSLEETGSVLDSPLRVIAVMDQDSLTLRDSKSVASICLRHRNARFLTLMLPPSVQVARLQSPALAVHCGPLFSPKLTGRQTEVLRLASCGLRNKEIALELGISEDTVEAHATKIFKKLGVRDRTAAVTVALRLGYIDLR